jgi:hypothetical protein
VPAQSSKGRETGKRSAAWWRRKKGDAREEIRQREKKNRKERELELPKDLCAISENCRDLFVKQNFPLI